MKSIIETSNLCKSYASEGQQMHILKNIDLKIYEGQFTVIMGPSGSGKSTLLYMLSGMDSVTAVLSLSAENSFGNRMTRKLPGSDRRRQD